MTSQFAIRAPNAANGLFLKCINPDGTAEWAAGGSGGATIFEWATYLVAPLGSQFYPPPPDGVNTFTSVSAAVSQAVADAHGVSNPCTILVRPGTYNEPPFTLPAGIELRGTGDSNGGFRLPSSSDAKLPVIVFAIGGITIDNALTAPGECKIEGIQFNSNADPVLHMTSTNQNNVRVTDCVFLTPIPDIILNEGGDPSNTPAQQGCVTLTGCRFAGGMGSSISNSITGLSSSFVLDNCLLEYTTVKVNYIDSGPQVQNRVSATVNNCSFFVSGFESTVAPAKFPSGGPINLLIQNSFLNVSNVSLSNLGSSGTSGLGSFCPVTFLGCSLQGSFLATIANSSGLLVKNCNHVGQETVTVTSNSFIEFDCTKISSTGGVSQFMLTGDGSGPCNLSIQNSVMDFIQSDVSPNEGIFDLKVAGVQINSSVIKVAVSSVVGTPKTNLIGYSNYESLNPLDVSILNSTLSVASDGEYLLKMNRNTLGGIVKMNYKINFGNSYLQGNFLTNTINYTRFRNCFLESVYGTGTIDPEYRFSSHDTEGFEGFNFVSSSMNGVPPTPGTFIQLTGDNIGVSDNSTSWLYVFVNSYMQKIVLIGSQQNLNGGNDVLGCQKSFTNGSVVITQAPTNVNSDNSVLIFGIGSLFNESLTFNSTVEPTFPDFAIVRLSLFGCTFLGFGNPLEISMTNTAPGANNAVAVANFQNCSINFRNILLTIDAGKTQLDISGSSISTVGLPITLTSAQENALGLYQSYISGGISMGIGVSSINTFNCLGTSIYGGLSFTADSLTGVNNFLIANSAFSDLFDVISCATCNCEIKNSYFFGVSGTNYSMQLLGSIFNGCISECTFRGAIKVSNLQNFKIEGCVVNDGSLTIADAPLYFNNPPLVNDYVLIGNVVNAVLGPSVKSTLSLPPMNVTMLGNLLQLGVDGATIAPVVSSWTTV